MSDFDKKVAQWVEGSNVSKDQKESLLNNINKNLQSYRRLENPNADKEREAREAELKKEERQRSLPPLPPSQSNSAPAEAPAKEQETRKKKKKGKATKKPAKATTPPAPVAVADESGGAAKKGTKAKAKATKKPKKAEGGEHHRSSVVKHVDFAFEDDVNKKLEQLNRESTAPRQSPPPPSSTRAGAGAGTGAEKSAEPAPAAAAPEPTKPKRAAPPLMATLSAEMESGDDDVDADALAGDADADDGQDATMRQMNAFTFGSAPESSHSGSSDGDEDRKGGAVVVEEEAYIEDKEDKRRRTIQMKRPSRLGISDGTVDVNEAMMASFPETPKSVDNVKTISRVLERHFLFSFLDDADIAKVASYMDLEEFAGGAVILIKGTSNDTFFVVLSGEARATLTDPETDEVATLALTKGSTFGDMGLMYECPNEVDVSAVSDTTCASLERHTYKLIVSRAMTERRQRYKKFLRSVPFFSSLSKAELSRLAESLKQDSYVKGQRIISRGQSNNWLHFVLEGTLNVVGGESGEESITTLKEGDFCGHLEFLNRHKSVADVVVASETVRTAKLSRRQFDTLVGDARGKLLKSIEEDQEYASYRNRMQSEAPPERDNAPAFDEPPAYLDKSIRRQEDIQKSLDDPKEQGGEDADSSTSSSSASPSAGSSPDHPRDPFNATQSA